MVYDEQVRTLISKHRKEKDIRGAEYLSGFSKTDKLLPVITLTILWDTTEWDAPRSLHEMLDLPDKRLLKYIPDYRINLISPNEIQDFDKFRTELSWVMEFLSVKNDPDKTKELFAKQSEHFSNLDLDSARLLNVCANLKLEIPAKNTEGGFDMCKAFEAYKEEGKTEGRVEGMKEMAIQMYRNMPTISLDVLANAANTSVETVKSWILGAGLQLR